MPPALQSPPSSAPPFARLRAGFERIPPRMRLVLGFVVLFGFAFSAAIVPLITQGNKVRAEVAGSVPSDGVAGQLSILTLGIDNTSDGVITPVCLTLGFDLPVTVRQVTVQGLDTVPFKDGRACGGSLTGQETTSVRVVLLPMKAGTLHVRLVASQGSREIGPAITRTMQVAPG